MDFGQVIFLLKCGKKVRVPEWAGYWKLESDKIMVYCQNEDVVEATHFQINVFRNDWEEVL
jgi:hypothetical protein